MPKLSAQVAIIGIGRLLNMAAAAGTMMVLARIMPDKESYGAILLLIMLYVMLSQIFAVGLPQSIYYFLPRYQGGEKRGFLTQVVILLLIAGGLLGCAFYLGADGLGRLLGTAKLPALLRIFAWYPLCMLPTLAVESTLLHYNRPTTAVIFNATVRVGMFCSLVIPTWLHAPLTHTVHIWVVVAGLMGIIALWLTFSMVRGLPVIWHGRMFRETWKFTLPLAALTLLSLCVSYLDRFIVSHSFGAAAFGAYSNATFEIPTVTMVTNATAIVLLAEFSRRTAANEETALLAIWHRATIKTGIVVLASFGFLVFWGHETMQLLFSSRFAESGAIFSIYVWNIPFCLFALRPLYVARGATLVLAGLTAWDFVTNSVCMLALGHIFGLKGIVYGILLAGMIGVSIWVHVYVRYLTRIGWKAFMPWAAVGLNILVALTAGGITRLLLLRLTRAWPMIAVFITAIVTFFLLYTLGLYLARLLDYILPTRFRRWRASARPAHAELGQTVGEP